MTNIPPQSGCFDTDQADTLPVRTAQHRILDSIVSISGMEVIPVANALHRILETPVRSSLNVPAHTNAAVDGFALKGCELPDQGKFKQFQIIGQALAGKPYTGVIGSTQAVSIMTGAALPEGADTVVMQEHVKRRDGVILVDDRHRPGENVRQAGEDIQRGEIVFQPGKYLLPPDLGLISSLGLVEITAKRKLRVALLSTGDEILPPGTPHEPGRLFDSNRFSLIGALHKLPVDILDYGIVPDDPAQLHQTFQQVGRRCDVVISSGGVSVGEADFTKQVLRKMGNIDFWKVAIKPGRPLAFGRIEDALFFGLPGNPVAVLVTFYLFVLPALFKLSGAEPVPSMPSFPAKTLERLRKKPGRTEFQRGILSRSKEGHWEVKLSGKQGSGVLTSMTRANCFIVLEHDRGRVEQGEWVEVAPFSMWM